MDDEGQDFASFFGGSYGHSEQRTEDRIKEERRAGRTPAQRARRARKTTQINFRTTEKIKALAQALADDMGVNVAGAVERAILDLAEKRDIH